MNLNEGRMAKIRPAQAVHIGKPYIKNPLPNANMWFEFIDQSSAGAFDRVAHHFPDEDIQALTKKYRVQIIK